MAPARIPPDEAFVDQSSPPWRVFDGPAATPARAADAAVDSPAASGLTSGGQALAVLGVAGAAIVGVLAVVIALGGSGGETIAGPEDGFDALSSDRAAAAGGEIVIDVAGAVVAPGVYRLPSDARVGDAIEAAGGFSPRVDADRVGAELNLAAALADGEQVRVPSRDDVQPTARGGGSGGTAGGDAGAGAIDLNTASQSELESLPGIGPVTAGKIIEARSENPFRSIDELRERGLVGEKTFEDIRALVTVG
jgi:competence protein ComEA